MDEFPRHILRLGDFAWDFRNHQQEQLLRAPHSAAARVHRWLTAAEGDCPPPPPRPNREFVATLHGVNGTLECPTQEDCHPYRDLPGVSRSTSKARSSDRGSSNAIPLPHGKRTSRAQSGHTSEAGGARQLAHWEPQQCSTPPSDLRGGDRKPNHGPRRLVEGGLSARGMQQPWNGCGQPQSPIRGGEVWRSESPLHHEFSSSLGEIIA